MGSAEQVARVLDGCSPAELLAVDLHDDAARAGLFGDTELDTELDADAVEHVRRHRRLYRAIPHGGDLAGRAREVAAGLVERGFVSAHHVSAVPRAVFVAEHADVCGGERAAAEIHHRAGQVRAAARHLVANVRDVASPYSRQLLGPVLDPALTSYLEALPGYQDLFGSLDYLACRECESIFGAAAYLLDLMRVTDAYVSQPCRPTIPPGYTLRERRRDLFTLDLTCENTEREVPYVSLVVAVLRARLEADLDDPVRALATAAYPFVLPWNEPLHRVVTMLARTGTSYAAAVASLRARDPDGVEVGDAHLAGVVLGLSPELRRLLTTPSPTDDAVAAQYGLDTLAAHLPAAGPGVVAIVAGERTATGGDGRLGTLVGVGQQIGLPSATPTVFRSIRTVTRIVSEDTVEVAPAWDETATTGYVVFPADDLTTAEVLGYRSETSYEGLDDLFGQGLDAAERAAGLASTLWLDATGEPELPALRVTRGAGGDPRNPVARVEGYSAKRFDRISRLLRLSRATGIAPADLDWLVVRDGGEITESFLVRLASLVRLADATGLPVVDASGYVWGLKTLGRGPAPELADPFDRVFNPASLRARTDPYAAPEPVPFDPGRPLAWPYGAGPGWAATSGTARGATARTIVLAESASPDDGAYDGLVVAVVSGTGAGRQAVVRSYDGQSRTATLWADWVVTPDPTSAYRVGAAPALAERLAAALRVGTADLVALGRYLADGLGVTSGILRLDLGVLTALWRLASVARTGRLPVDGYLTLRGLAGLPARPPADADGALADVVAALAACAWANGSGLTVPEAGYVVTGVPSRTVRPPYDPEQLGALVDDAAGRAAEFLVTPAVLAEAGLPADDAVRVHAALVAAGYLDERGVALPARAAFAAAAAAFPVTAAGLAGGSLTETEAALAIAELRAQQPPYLVSTVAPASSALGFDYPAGTELAFLFVDVPDAPAKRGRVTDVLDRVVRDVVFTEFAPFVPVRADSTFTGRLGGRAQSAAVFERLTELGVLLALPDATTAALAATWTTDTPLPGLFTTPATGQVRGVASYDGTTRTATVTPAWTTVPDAFAVYRVVRPDDAGAARGGTDVTIRLAESASPVDGAYVGAVVVVTGGPGEGTVRRVVAYDGPARTATVAPAWGSRPADGTPYAVGPAVAEGSANGATTGTIVLSDDAVAVDDAYAGCVLVLVPDPDASAKLVDVRQVLGDTERLVDTLAAAVAAARAAQAGVAAATLAALLGVPVSRIEALLPMATGEPSLGTYLPALLTPAVARSAPRVVVDLVARLARAGLAGARLGLSDAVLRGITRRPDRYGLPGDGTLTFAGLRAASALPALAAAIGADAAAVVTFLDVSPELVGEHGRLAALNRLTGWPAEDVATLGAYLAEHVAWPGLGTLDGLRRLLAPFRVLDAAGGDADLIVRLAQVAELPAVRGGADDAEVWARYDEAVHATAALLGLRYEGTELTAVTDQVTREVDAATRDALLGFTIDHLQHSDPPIPVRTPGDLLSYLLVDVEMSGCDTTSPVAQAVASVQLYLQRVRMGVEDGADTARIPGTWWQWLSTYRAWQANRKVFVYPENYLEPALRKDATPQFRALVEQLLQGQASDENAASAMADYFEAFQDVASLVHVGAYKLGSNPREGGQVDEPTLLVARTATTPYRYFTREMTRSLLPETAAASPGSGEVLLWRPWQAMDLVTIDAPEVTPVVAFDRLFLFWTEVAATKSSKVTTSTTNGSVSAESSTESVWEARLKFTFRGSTGTWSTEQVLGDPVPLRALPNTYEPLTDEYLATAFGATQAYWQRPFAQPVPRGIPASGTLSGAAGANLLAGAGTALDRQVKPGDAVWVGGAQWTVLAVDAQAQTATVDGTLPLAVHGAPFKVVPRDIEVTRFAAFTGPGTVEIGAVPRDPELVTGHGNSRFLRDFAVGDALRVGHETRAVVSVFDDSHLYVDRPWTASSNRPRPGMVEVYPRLYTVDAVDGASFDGLKEGDVISVVGQWRTIGDIESETQLLVTEPFDVTTITRAPYGEIRFFDYTAIPRARGDERLAVVFGANVDVQRDVPDPTSDGYTQNPGDDPFLAARNAFNHALYAALRLRKTVRTELGDVAGDVTAIPALVLDDALDTVRVPLFAPAYDEAVVPGAALPVRVALDPENDVLFARPSPHLLVATYWGNAAPGTTQNQDRFGAGDRPLLFHVPPASSVYGFGNQIGWYLVNAGTEGFWVARNDPLARPTAPSTFLRTFWQSSDATAAEVSFGPFTTDGTPFADTTYRVTRLTTGVVHRLYNRLLAGGFDRLLALDSQSLPETPFDQFYEVPGGAPPPGVDAAHLPSPEMDFAGAYGLYFWEVFFHAPLLVAQQLRQNGRHADAQRWYEYVYDPNADPSAGEGLERYWRFRPFREGMTLPGLREVLTDRLEISVYNDDPFDPDAIAALRISAYAKSTVLKYVDNLLEWGDALFAQDTRESIAQATNLYVLASDLLGPRPRLVGRLPARPPMSFDRIKAEYPHGIPQFLIAVEDSTLLPVSGAGARFADVPVNDVDAYFRVPENAELAAYWDRVEDRLYKIRHCMDIAGAERALALFAPPIDVRQAIAASGAGPAGLGAAALAPGPVPPFRFSYLVGYARSVAQNAAQLGAALLRALESGDADALATLELEQQVRVLDLTRAVQTLQATALAEERTALQAGRDGAEARRAHYQSLLTAGYLPTEIAQLVYLTTGMVSQAASTILKTAAALGFALPQVGSPFAMTYGGQQVGGTLEQASAAVDSFAQTVFAGAEALGVTAMQQRRVEEWTLQEALAGFDVAQLDAQLTANATQSEIAARELAIAERQLANNAALRDFYRTKFTNAELYQWLANRLAAAYFQTYRMALDLTRLAERALQYEMASGVRVVVDGWSEARRGLTAADGLLVAIDQLESARITGTARRGYEITKAVSLAGLDPLAFLGFLRTGEATFDLPERLFDNDFPGHYRRRIKSVSVTIPALVGPYRNVSATLTQTANRVVLRPDLDAVRFLLGEDVTVAAGVVEHNVRAGQSIAISLGQGDTGVFDPAPDAALLLPFENTGAVSSWRLAMPPANNPFDLRTISDVVLEVRYTAHDGGAAFARDVAALPRLRDRAWSTTALLAQQFPASWYAFMTGHVEHETQRLTVALTDVGLPNVAGTAVVAGYVRLVVPDGVPTTSRTAYLTLTVGDGPPVVFTPGAEHAYFATYQQPVSLGGGPLSVELAFDLRPGATPAGLRDAKGDRLAADVLQDVELVLFLTGVV